MNNVDETSYLLNSPVNAARLMQSIEEYKQGLGEERKLIEDGDSKFEKLNSLTKEDYQNHFKVRAKANKETPLNDKQKDI
jgi:hypothetical protein